MTERGGQPRNRTIDLAIAATANVHKVPLLTENIGDFAIISDLVDAWTLASCGQTRRTAAPHQSHAELGRNARPPA